MKVKFKYGIKTYSGTIDDMTYGSFRKHSVCIGREYVMPTLNANNTLRGTIMKNLAEIWGSVTSGYKEEMKVYAAKNAVNTPQGQLVPSAFAVFTKMMYLFAKLDDGHIDLSTVTYSDLETVGTDIASVALSVDNGYLEPVDGYEELDTTM